MNMQRQSGSQSKGALIFAFNGTIDYVTLAITSAKLIKHFLGIPTTIVTDSPIEYENTIIVENNSNNTRTFRWNTGTETVNWKNIGRFDAYELSPYDRTLLLDADYLVNSKNLSTVLDSDAEICLFTDVYDVSGIDSFGVDRFINFNSLQMYWATVIVFDKCPYVNSVFELWKSVYNNWDYYKTLYNFKSSTFRNDFAFTIALNTLQGFVNKPVSIPWKLPTLSSMHTIKEFKNNRFIVEFPHHQTNNVVMHQTLWGSDLHIMNKKSVEYINDIKKNLTI